MLKSGMGVRAADQKALNAHDVLLAAYGDLKGLGRRENAAERQEYAMTSEVKRNAIDSYTYYFDAVVNSIENRPYFFAFGKTYVQQDRGYFTRVEEAVVYGRIDEERVLKAMNGKEEKSMGELSESQLGTALHIAFTQDRLIGSSDGEIFMRDGKKGASYSVVRVPSGFVTGVFFSDGNADYAGRRGIETVLKRRDHSVEMTVRGNLNVVREVLYRPETVAFLTDHVRLALERELHDGRRN